MGIIKSIQRRSTMMFFFFKIYFIDYAITVVPIFLTLPSSTWYPAFPPAIPPTLFSSCPWVMHISSLASTFPILFLTSPCLFSTYHLYYLHSVPSPPHSPIDNPPCDLHFCDSVPVLVVYLVCFCFCFLGSFVNSCEFVAILLFIVLIFLFFLDKSL